MEKKEQPVQSFLVPILSREKRFVFFLLIGIWILSFSIFIFWWCKPEHIIEWKKFAVNTLLILWINILPGYFFLFTSRMKQVNPGILLPGNWRVAMVTTRAPSEPFHVLKVTLTAMLNQKYPHDTWLADEDPSEEIMEWCRNNSIRVSTRKNNQAYHCESWPRRTKCKEGNLAFFYDHFGYELYDIVVQLDADHIPEANYLEEMIRPFVNEKIGYVSAPSICDSNKESSWTARGRLFSEALMHGPLQAGYSGISASLCIGSHYAVRTKALKEIGGLGPELAEDHSTTLMMNGYGWKGIHAMHAIAHGEGPATISDCITQEFQWSRSLMILLLTELPKYWKKLSVKHRFLFLFSELWYPLFGIMFSVGTVLPIIAVLTGEPWMKMSYLDFLIFNIPVDISVLSMVLFLKWNKLFRPYYAPVLSWETILFQVVRWPWAMYGSVMGVVAVIVKKTPAFKVTPKGNSNNSALRWTILFPYIFIILISALPGIFIQEDNNAKGYHYFLIMNALVYTLLIFFVLILHRYESKRIEIALS